MAASATYANVFDVRGNKVTERFYGGGELAITAHIEEGLDKSKGEYSVSYAAFGGSLVAQYHFTDFYLQGGVGLMRLLNLTVNNLKIDMTDRTQWHVPVYGHVYYKVHPIIGIGTGITHLTETTMYLNSAAVPSSSYNHIFLDLAVQGTPELTQGLHLLVTTIIGINLIPGRQHVYAVGDLLHLRFQLNLGLIYAIF